MTKSSFRALGALLIGIPLLTVVAFIAHPSSRAYLSALASPPPLLAPRTPLDAGALTLAPAARPLGVESVELRTLREDTPATTGLDASVRATPAALFAVAADGSLIAPPGPYARPAGLRRPDLLGARDDPRVDYALHQVTANAQVRERFVEPLRQTARSKLDIVRILRIWKLPDAVLAVIFVGSDGRDHAQRPDASSSDDDGVGAWRLTRDVAHVYGLTMLPQYDERLGIASGTEAAAHYLADLHERFGSWELALVAFGFGYRATLDELAKHQGMGFWELAPSLPAPVSVYVAQVLAAAIVLDNLDRFGLESVVRDAPVTTSELEVNAGTALDLVAKASGVPALLVHELNPEYTAGMVPTTGFAMVVHVPSETFVRAREMLPRLAAGDTLDLADGGNGAQPAAGSPSVVSHGSDPRLFYRVREGDTLASLAKQYEVSPETLASDNALDPTGSLKVGMILAIRLPKPEVPASPVTPPKKTKQHGR